MMGAPAHSTQMIAKAAQWLLACDGNKVQEYVDERYHEALVATLR